MAFANTHDSNQLTRNAKIVNRSNRIKSNAANDKRTEKKTADTAITSMAFKEL